MPRKSAKRKEIEEAFVERILDERGGESADNKKRKHEYLCAWTDGADPQWVVAAQLEGTPAVEECDEAEDEQPEIHDSRQELKEKCHELVGWMKDAKRPVFLLGAGMSAPVLPTFRGKNGLWTKNAHRNKLANAKVSDGIQPTLAHRALAKLEKAGFVYWVATQNYDDLSIRSGYPESKLSELHGNIFTEVCAKCNTKYRRDFEVPLEDAVNHETGRTCEECKDGVLKDCIVHFDEPMPWHQLKMANAKFVGADLTIALGSSLKVEPAASLPFKSKSRSRSSAPKACIVNLQATRMDDQADLLIHGTCDAVMNMIAATLVGADWDVAQA